MANVPEGDMRGVFGVWWYRGVRIEKNFAGKYLIQDGHSTPTLEKALELIDALFGFKAAHFARYGYGDDWRDVYGWPGGEGMKTAAGRHIDIWDVFFLLIGTCIGQLASGVLPGWVLWIAVGVLMLLLVSIRVKPSENL